MHFTVWWSRLADLGSMTESFAQYAPDAAIEVPPPPACTSRSGNGRFESTVEAAKAVTDLYLEGVPVISRVACSRAFSSL